MKPIQSLGLFLLAMLSGALTALAQKPQGADFLCNAYAGTFKRLQFQGQSNDTARDTVFFCLGDSLYVKSNGDFDLSGDPVPATPAGICWTYYKCPPMVSGPDFLSILADTCRLNFPGATNGLLLPVCSPDGSGWIRNDGAYQTVINNEAPLQFFAAPITVDNLTGFKFEAAAPGDPMGPCLNVNLSAAFSAVFLNKIWVTGIDSNFSSPCLGKFRLHGGYPEWDHLKGYQVGISLDADTSIHALVMTSQIQLLEGTDVLFSAPQAGVYDVSVVDGKSCGLTFKVNMNNCQSDPNVVFTLPAPVSGQPGGQVSIPLSVRNFNVVSASFSIQWDTTYLVYTGTTQLHAAIAPYFNESFNLNKSAVQQGKLGVLLYNSQVPGQALTVPDGDTLLAISFHVRGGAGGCSPVLVNNSLIGIQVENLNGQPRPVSVHEGRFCVAPLASQEPRADLQLGIWPNPAGNAGTATLVFWSGEAGRAEIRVAELTGAVRVTGAMDLAPGMNRYMLSSAGLPAGCYVVTVVTGWGITSIRWEIGG